MVFSSVVVAPDRKVVGRTHRVAYDRLLAGLPAHPSLSACPSGASTTKGVILCFMYNFVYLTISIVSSPVDVSLPPL